MRGDQAPWDTYSDTWTGVDSLGRRLPTNDEVGDPRPDRFVAMFYFLWHGAQVDGGPWDISRIIANDPRAMEKHGSPPWGPLHAFHHWAEPLFGYYRGDDRWVLRRHAQMLAEAGVDTLVFDTSNRLTFEDNYTALFETLVECRRDGNATPDVAFLAPFWDPGSTVRLLYDRLYSRGLYQELWFRWEGKPLILANPAQVDPGIRSFFTFRRPQPSYHHGAVDFDEKGYYPERGPQPDLWAWLEVTPQHVFRNARGEIEEMAVGVSQNAIRDPNAPPAGDSRGLRTGSMSEPGSLGRSYSAAAGREVPGGTDAGTNFQEQWDRALAVDPRLIFVTGWNEWLGERLDDFMGVQAPVLFVDTYDREHSRDIEPMRGGHGDAYYGQLVANVRRFKGARALPLSSPARTIDIDGSFRQWDDVGPEYRDAIGDTAHRDHPGYASSTRYVNRTGRNDLVVMKVARDEGHLFFYARTRGTLSPCTDPAWMLLFLAVGGVGAAGWHGFTHLVNWRVRDELTTTVHATREGWNWQPCAETRFRAEGSELMIAVPRAALGMAPGAPVHLEFKWADNIQLEDSVEAFLLDGDCAPSGRFTYLYEAAASG